MNEYGEGGIYCREQQKDVKIYGYLCQKFIYVMAPVISRHLILFHFMFTILSHSKEEWRKKKEGFGLLVNNGNDLTTLYRVERNTAPRSDSFENFIFIIISCARILHHNFHTLYLPL